MLITLLTAAIIGAVLASYLGLLSNLHVAVVRAQAWNACIPVAEAGIEEALTQLHYYKINQLGPFKNSNWVLGTDGYYLKISQVGSDGSYCEVAIQQVDPPVIVSTGYVPAPLAPNCRPSAPILQVKASSPLAMILAQITTGSSASTPYVRRKVRVTTRRNAFYPVGPMIVKEGVKLNGNNIATDSFNSTNALYSTSGKYDPAKARDHGDIASVSGLSDAVNTGNADIKGYLSTGPGGSVDVGKRGSVGDKAWVEGGNLGLQPGHVSNDMNMEFVDVDLPS